MKALEDDTDYKLKTVKESEINLMEMDEASLRQHLKDRQHGNDYINDVEDGRKRLEQYIKAIDREITKRRQVIELLTHGGKYYGSLRGEASIVATVSEYPLSKGINCIKTCKMLFLQAYSNFGKRVANLNKKLSEKLQTLDRSGGRTSSHHHDVPPSPIPSPRL